MKLCGMKGFFALTISGLLCKAIGVLFRLPLTYILGVEGLGFFQLIMGVYSFAIVFASGGMAVTLSKLISSARAKGENKKIGSYMFVAFVYSLVASCVLGVIFFALSKPLALIQGVPKISGAYKLFFPLIFLSSLVSLLRGVAQGYENMLPTAVSQTFEQVGKFSFGVMFAYIFARSSVQQGAIGALLGMVVSEFIAFIYLLIAKKDERLKFVKASGDEAKEFFKFFSFSSMAIAVSAFVHFFDSLVVVERLTKAGMSTNFATSLFGLQTGIVGAFLNFPIIISVSLATAVLPKLAFSKERSIDEVKTSSKNGFEILWFLLLPTTLGLLGVGLPLFQLLYPFLSQEMYFYLLRLMAIGSVSTILVGLGQYFIALLQAQGEFKYVFISQVVGGVAKIICTIFLCPITGIGIFGIAIGNLVFAVIVTVMVFIKVRTFVKVGTDEFYLPLIGACTMLVGITMIVFFVPMNLIVKLCVCVVFGASVYFATNFKLLARFKTILFGKNQRGRECEKERVC